jgi:hypothetical protein
MERKTTQIALVKLLDRNVQNVVKVDRYLKKRSPLMEALTRKLLALETSNKRSAN